MRATWAPKGKTPVLTHHFNWKRLSMVSVLCYSPDSTDACLVFGMHPGTYNDERLIEFLEAFHDEMADDKVTLIWDGLMSHRSKAMTAWVNQQRSWLRVERLPSYAPDLNPVELVWGNVKSAELANYCPDTIDEAEMVADAGLQRIGGDAGLCRAFLRHTGLSL